MLVYSYSLISGKLDDALFQHLLSTLPKPDQQKTKAYQHDRDQQNCLIGRLMLRHLLLNYFDCPANCLEQLYKNKYGKLFLNNQLDFNISHAGDLVLCAISDEGAVGVDVEKKVSVNLKEMSSFLLPEELETIQSASDQEEAFYEIWTRKESLLKALGRGLSVDLQQVAVQKYSGYWNEHPNAIWQFYPLILEKEYITTICTEKRIDPVFHPSDNLLKWPTTEFRTTTSYCEF
jgi:4'-phosphopantetheinyl transferase